MTATHARLAAARTDVGRYYGERLARFGPTPLGVGWTCVPTQELRFVQIARLFGDDASYSVNDIGCGYGALFAFLRRRWRNARIDYLGLDLSPTMVDEARRKWRQSPEARFEVAAGPYRVADYCVASGIFNVKLGQDRGTWEELVAQTIADMYGSSRRGAAVNFLAEDASLEEVAEHYRCAPETWIDYGRRLGASVEVRTDYGMPEFTLMLLRQ